MYKVRIEGIPAWSNTVKTSVLIHHLGLRHTSTGSFSTYNSVYPLP